MIKNKITQYAIENIARYEIYEECVNITQNPFDYPFFSVLWLKLMYDYMED